MNDAILAILASTAKQRQVPLSLTINLASPRSPVRPDKAKVVDEVWDDARVESFLHKGTLGAETNLDYCALLFAYRSMRPGDFARFLALFSSAGRDLNAQSRNGQSLLTTISPHRRAAPFVELLRNAGAQA